MVLSLQNILKNTRLTRVLFLLVVFLLLYFGVNSSHGFLWRLPETMFWQVPIVINHAIEYLLFEWFPIQVYDADLNDYEEKALFSELTRSFSGFIEFLIYLVRETLLGGVKTVVFFTDWDFVSDYEWLRFPAMPWTILVAGIAIIGYIFDGIKLALFCILALTYIAIFGQWEAAMETLSFVLVAATLSIVLGLVLGVLAFKSKGFESILSPLLSVAQTMPHYSYLVPAVVLFGIGDHAGSIATVIFATPPMVRLTLLGLKKVSNEVLEAGMMSGCTKFQQLIEVQIPTARRDILIGVNQVIMQCLAMAVIASFIGTKGLGFNLLVALNQLRIGLALELGVSIVLMAIMLDKLSLAWANKQTDYFVQHTTFIGRHKYVVMFCAFIVIGILFAIIGRSIFADGINYFYIIPSNAGLTTENFWDSGVNWVVENWYQGLQAFNVFLITKILVPLKNTFLSSPFIAVWMLVAGTGYILGGIRSAVITSALIVFIALTPWWDRALITCYMMTFAVLVSMFLGFVIGILCSQSDKASKNIILICNTLQTFPSFIYLIPVIMLFGVTDTSVLLAVIVYATIPATRYTVEGIRSVPEPLLEAATMSGANPIQKLLYVKLPLAMPHITLGVNQTVMFSLFMIIIGAFIGTDDLGQLILKALSEENGMGNGIMLGLCVAFIGLTVDHLINQWSKTRKKELGLA